MWRLPPLLLCPLLTATPLSAQEAGGAAPAPPELPAPLAWLVDRDDHPLVSRDLVVLEPGAPAPRVALERLLYSFDAADLQAVGWDGGLLYASGPRPSARPSPNVPLPLHALRRTDAGWAPLGVEHAAAAPERFLTSPTGCGVLTLDLTRLGWLAPGETAEVAVDVLLEPRRGLGRSQLRAALWAADGRAVFAAVQGRPGGMQEGLWRLRARLDDDGRVAGFEPPERLADTLGVPHQALPDGSFLTLRRTGAEHHAPREALRVWPGTDRPRALLAQDVHWSAELVCEPLVLGRAERPAEPPALAYVRAVDGALVLRTGAPDGRVARALLWHAPDRPPGGLAWSPDARWLAFHARDAERRSWVFAVELASGATHRLGPGLRPAWGPPR